jgi:2,4'-dihydroxyacetophenone dioxygenase
VDVVDALQYVPTKRLLVLLDGYSFGIRNCGRSGMTLPSQVLLKSLHVDSEAVPWVVEPGLRTAKVEMRVLHARPDEELYVTQVRAHPGSESSLHRHRGQAFAFTTKGMWGHDRTYPYRPGVYTYEMPGLVHQFLNGTEVSEVFFVSQGAVEFLNPAAIDEVVGTLTAADVVRGYFEACENAGLTRPNILL